MDIIDGQKFQKYLQELVTQLRNRAPVDTGDLKRSISFQSTTSNTSIKTQLSMNYYGLFQDKGVNGRLEQFGSPYSFKSRDKGLKPQNWIAAKLDTDLSDIGDKILEASWDKIVAELVTSDEAGKWSF